MNHIKVSARWMVRVEIVLDNRTFLEGLVFELVADRVLLAHVTCDNHRSIVGRFPF